MGVIPTGVHSGENSLPRDGDNIVLIESETGGLVTKDLTGAETRVYVDFSPLKIIIKDAHGQPVPGDPVSADVVSATTNEDGVSEVETSGEVDVVALSGTLEDTVQLGDDGTTVEYQYSGLEGSVETPDGDPIAGKIVNLLVGSGEPYDSTTTDENGRYEFARVPPDMAFYAEASPYHRPADSRGQGEWVLRGFPSRQMRRGDPHDYELVEEDDLISVGVEVVDSETSEPIKGTEVIVGDFRVETESGGRGRGFVDRTVTDSVPITAGKDRRYRRREEIAEIGEEPIELELPLDRYVKSSQK
ncbi:hypothetical protein [Natrinema longum]|nr:hypothetical protein [Natrinema longum]MBZ6496026.1 hypothetical protein [Natrinema longum]